MNDLLVALGIEGWKPVLGTLVMPPVPFIVLILAGGRLMFRNRVLAWLLLVTGTLGVWFMCTGVAADQLQRLLLHPPRALSPSEIADLRRSRTPRTAIVVLGAGRYLLAPEYGVSNLTPMSMERLRYGIWLARETGLPLAFSGGVGHGGDPGPSEAEIAGRIAEREFRQPLRWTEGGSRDTNENAIRTVALLRDAGVERIVLVTHGFHERRAIAAFERAAGRSGAPIAVLPAPMAVGTHGSYGVLDWIPTRDGYAAVTIALHEWLGRLAGA